MTWADSWPAESGSLSLTAELSTDRDFADAPPRKRQADRLPVDLDAGLRQPGAAGVSVQIIDLSTNGFRATTHLALEKGRDVWPAWTRGQPRARDVAGGLLYRLCVRAVAPSGGRRDDRVQVRTPDDGSTESGCAR